MAYDLRLRAQGSRFRVGGVGGSGRCLATVAGVPADRGCLRRLPPLVHSEAATPRPF